MATSDSVPLKAAPRLSVVIPAYNAAPYIAETLASVFAQTFTDFEAILVNDGSPDTQQLKEAIRPYCDRIVYLEQENRGPSAARNAGILAARGELVAFLDSDDRWRPEFLATQVEVLRQQRADLVYADGIHVGDGPLAGRNQMRNSPSNGPATFHALLVEDCKVLTSLTVARREAVLEAGLFDERFSHCEDYDLWLRMAHRGRKIVYHKQVLGWHRLRSGSLASVDAKMLTGAIGVLTKLDQQLQMDEETRGLLRRQRDRFQARIDLEQGKDNLRTGDFKRAGELLARASAFHPSAKLRLTLAGLRIAPRLTAFGVKLWERR
jgi:glycosyltransferase involved in cell wall biosynthesis